MEDEETERKGKGRDLFAASRFSVGDDREGRVRLFLHRIGVLVSSRKANKKGSTPASFLQIVQTASTGKGKPKTVVTAIMAIAKWNGQ